MRPSSPEPEMKIIDYRGGLILFRVPATWTEKYEKDGGGTFYADAPESSTLRVNVLTLRTNMKELAPEEFIRQLSSQRPPGPVERLPSENCLKNFFTDCEEDGEELRIYFWLVVHFAPPLHARIAQFSYTVLRRLAERPEIQAELAVMDRELREVRFTSLNPDEQARLMHEDESRPSAPDEQL